MFDAFEIRVRRTLDWRPQVTATFMQALLEYAAHGLAFSSWRRSAKSAGSWCRRKRTA